MASSTSTFPSDQDLMKCLDGRSSKQPLLSPFISTPQHYDRSRGALLVGAASTKLSRSFLALIVTLLTLTWTLWNCPILLWNAGSQIEWKTAPAVAAGAPLEVFQVYPPVQHLLMHQGNKDLQPLNDKKITASTHCSSAGYEILLMNHSFGFSYGKPFVGDYSPPDCTFNRVTMNFTVFSKGRQFDRLAIMYLNNTEIYRTSTAEPTFNGIHWEYIKDVSMYLSLWNSPQKIIFDLGNLVNDMYTASFDTILTATFSFLKEPLDPANLILPISANQGYKNKSSVFMLPKDNATSTFQIPRNVKRASISISACGQAAEEFWWANTLQSRKNTFKDVVGTLYGHSPFREVQVLIDGQLAGVQWPFPVIFTGGVVPGLWRPIVGIQAFDIQEHEIDITPWLPLLCDGQKHTFSIIVVGIDDSGKSMTLMSSVDDSWYVTGKVWLWLDSDPEAVPTGKTPTLLLPDPAIEISSVITQDKDGANRTMNYTVNVQRTLSISSLITRGTGTYLSTWTQNLAVKNFNAFTNYGRTQYTDQQTTALDQSTGVNFYSRKYRYPLQANTTFLDESSGNFSIDAMLSQGWHVATRGRSIFDPSVSTTLSTVLNGSAHYFASPKAKLSRGFGSTSQVFDYVAVPESRGMHILDANLGKESRRVRTTEKKPVRYCRSVFAVNGTVVKDEEHLNDKSMSKPTPLRGVTSSSVAARDPLAHPREMIGRGASAARSSRWHGMHARRMEAS